MLPLYEDPHFTFCFADDRIIPVQPPNGMSSKSGTVVPGFTRTWLPTENLAKAGGRFGWAFFFFFCGMAISPQESMWSLYPLAGKPTTDP